jgi:hypothetical protein
MSGGHHEQIPGGSAMKALNVVAVFVLAASASCLAASPAHAQAPSPSFDLIAVDGATLLAKGVAFSVKVTYVCSDVDFADGSVYAQQRVQGAQMAHGNLYFPTTCDATVHVEDVMVTSIDIPFKRGEALVSTFVGGCGTDSETQQQICSGDSLTQVMRIR